MNIFTIYFQSYNVCKEIDTIFMLNSGSLLSLKFSDKLLIDLSKIDLLNCTVFRGNLCFMCFAQKMRKFKEIDLSHTETIKYLVLNTVYSR